MAADNFNAHNAQISLVFLCAGLFLFFTFISPTGPWWVGLWCREGSLKVSQEKVTKAQKLKKECAFPEN